MTRSELLRYEALLAGFLIAGLSFGCSRQESHRPTQDFREVALNFTKALTDRDYSKAYAMTSQDYRKQMAVNEMQAQFEAIVPRNWGAMGPVEVGQTLSDWPDKRPADLGRAYVSIGGNVYSEAVAVVVTVENGEAKVRQVEFGRP
jgi:hypothetical protein